MFLYSALCRYTEPLRQYLGKPWHWKSFLRGAAAGALLVCAFYSLLWFFGVGVILPSNALAPATVLHACVVGLLVGFTEELLFRGLMQKEFEMDLTHNGGSKSGSGGRGKKGAGNSSWRAKLALALTFAFSHLSREAFAGLAALSLCLSEAKRRFGGSLSYAMGLHASLVATNMVFHGSQVYVVFYSRLSPRPHSLSHPHFR